MNMIRGMKYSFLGLWENPKKKEISQIQRRSEDGNSVFRNIDGYQV
jgi:hypothetical protein